MAMATTAFKPAPAADMTLPPPVRTVEEGKRVLDEYGFCVHENFLSPELLKALKERLVEQAELECEQGVALLSGQSRGGKTWYGGPENGVLPGWQGVSFLINKGRVFIDMAMDKRLHEYMRHAFQGCSFNLCASTGLVVRRGAEPMVVHVDQQFVPFRTPMPVFMNVMICLTEFEEVMGATRVIPKSHLWPTYPAQAFDPVRGAHNPEPIDTVAVECPAGAAIFFDGRTWHQSGTSTSDKTRLSISTMWSQSWVKPMDDNLACLHDEVYKTLSNDELDLLGFKAEPSGRIEPRFPGDRQNTNRKTPYVPELRRGSAARAVKLGSMVEKSLADEARAMGLRYDDSKSTS